MVVFIKGKKAPKHYRKYTIRSAQGGDDYAMLREALERRYSEAKEKGLLPDLLLIDGGKGHLELARFVLSTLDISTVDVVGMAKQKSKHTKGLTAEQLFLADRDEPLLLDAASPLLFFLQNIRDEAHRFVLAFQRNKRSRSSLHSVLDTLPGIGTVKKKRLLSHFGSVKRILQATPTEWLAVPGITQRDVERLQELQQRSTP
jgi:excinuclease ABC subunit C